MELILRWSDATALGTLCIFFYDLPNAICSLCLSGRSRLAAAFLAGESFRNHLSDARGKPDFVASQGQMSGRNLVVYLYEFTLRGRRWSTPLGRAPPVSLGSPTTYKDTCRKPSEYSEPIRWGLISLGRVIDHSDSQAADSTALNATLGWSAGRRRDAIQNVLGFATQPSYSHIFKLVTEFLPIFEQHLNNRKGRNLEKR
jgi:hypothetical protein